MNQPGDATSHAWMATPHIPVPPEKSTPLPPSTHSSQRGTPQTMRDMLSYLGLSGLSQSPPSALLWGTFWNETFCRILEGENAKTKRMNNWSQVDQISKCKDSTRSFSNQTPLFSGHTDSQPSGSLKTRACSTAPSNYSEREVPHQLPASACKPPPTDT